MNNKDENSRDPLEEETRKHLRRIQRCVVLTGVKEVVSVRHPLVTFELSSDSPRGTNLAVSLTRVRYWGNKIGPTNPSSILEYKEKLSERILW